MRTIVYLIVAICIAGQALILSDGAQLVRGFEQAVAGVGGALLVFLLLLVIEALVVVVWLGSARYRFAEAVRHQESEEEKAEIGQTSRLPEIRGRSIAKQISATSDRMRISGRTIIGSVLPILLTATAALGLALWLASIAFAIQ